jgi:hypothetical protein
MVELLDTAIEVMKVNGTADHNKSIGIHYCGTGKAFNGYCSRNCVYTWRRNGTWLYIGASSCGTYRIQSHEYITTRNIKIGDAIYFYFLDLPWEDELAQETRLINKYNPVYNINGRTGNKHRNKINAGLYELFNT